MGIYLDLGSWWSGGVIPSWTTWHYCKLTNNWWLECDWDSSNWGWNWDSIWTQNESTTQTNGFGGLQTIVATIHPKSNTYNVNIWDNNNTLYKLNVNWSWRFATKLNVWDNFLILSGQKRQVYVPWDRCVAGSERYATSPTIRYNGTLAFRDNDLLQCSNWYTEIGDNGSMWIGWPSESANTKLSVYWHTRIYSNASATERYIDLYHDSSNGVSNMISKRSNMRIGLTWSQDVLWVTLPSSYIYISKTNVWINKLPKPSTWNSSTNTWYYSPTLQVSGSIQISSESPVSNSTQTNNKMICNEKIEWTIAYYNGNFYGCGKTNWNTYRWRSIDTSHVDWDNLPALPSSTR